jgi:hypothetical protein
MALCAQEIQKVVGDVGVDGKKIAALRMAVNRTVGGRQWRRYMQKIGVEWDSVQWTERCRTMENQYVDVEAAEWLALADILGVEFEMFGVYYYPPENSNYRNADGESLVDVFPPINGTSREAVQVVHSDGYEGLGAHFEPVIVEYSLVTARRYFLLKDCGELNLMGEGHFTTWLRTRRDLANADSPLFTHHRNNKTGMFGAIMTDNGFTWKGGGRCMNNFCKGWDLFMSSLEQNCVSENDFGVFIIQHMQHATRLKEAIGLSVQVLQRAAAAEVGEAYYNLDVLNKCGVIKILHEEGFIAERVREAHLLSDRARSLGFTIGTSDVNEVIEEARVGDKVEMWNLVILSERDVEKDGGMSAFLVPMEARVMTIFDTTVCVKFMCESTHWDLLHTVKEPSQKNRVLQLRGSTAGSGGRPRMEEVEFMEKIGRRCPVVVEMLAKGAPMSLVELACLALVSDKNNGFELGPERFDDRVFREYPKKNFGANFTRVLKV